MKLILIMMLVFILFISYAHATCTVTFDKVSYVPGETVTAEMSCSDSNEKSKAYTLTWGNETGGNELETDSGTTPATENEIFFDDFILGLAVGNFTINATLTGTNLEGYDSATVAGAGASTLVVTNATSSADFIGRVGSVNALVFDENSKQISGGWCKFSVWSNDGTKMVFSDDDQMYEGEIKFEWILSQNRLSENTQYAYKIRCFCGSDGGRNECIDEDGTAVEDSTGVLTDSFTTNSWLTVNTLTDLSLYEPKQEVFVCANVTNVNYTSRIPMGIYHQIRCSAGTDTDTDLDRALVVSDDMEPDIRGIGVGSTQMQCKRFVLPEAKHLEGKDSQCYASTDVFVLDNLNDEIYSYHTTSPVFNITSTSLNINGYWQKITDNVFQAIINLSDRRYQEYDGELTVGNIELRINKPFQTIDHTEQYIVGGTSFIHFQHVNDIKNTTVRLLNGSLISSFIEINEDGLMEIEVRNQQLNRSGWYNFTMELNNFDERLTIASEGLNKTTGELLLEQKNQSVSLRTIANNTGTFLFDIQVDPEIFDDVFDYVVAVQRERGVGDIEGTFECYVEGYQSQTLDRWQQMIEYPTGNAMKRTLSMPGDAPEGEYYTLQCQVGTAGLGNTITSAKKTFLYHGPKDSIFDILQRKSSEPKDILPKISILSGLKKNPEIVLIFAFICLIMIFINNPKKRENEQRW